MEGLDGEIAIPPAELKEEIVGHAKSRILQLRSERDCVFRFQGRQVDDANSREMLVIPLFDRPAESTQPHDTGTHHDEQEEKGNDEHEMVHGDARLSHD